MDRFVEITALQDESSMTGQFSRIANEFSSNWIIEKEDEQFEILESEYLCSFLNGKHTDPFIDGSPFQHKKGIWYISDGGVDITFGTEAYSAALFIRAIKNVKTGEHILGPNRVFMTLFQNTGHIQYGCAQIKFLRRPDPIQVQLIAVPRVSLNIEYSSKNLDERLKYVFRPYRFVRSDIEDFPEKYLSYLYLEKVEKSNLEFNREGKIYDKYLIHFDKGMNAHHIDQVWNVSSRSLRMATLLGYMHKRQLNQIS